MAKKNKPEDKLMEAVLVRIDKNTFKILNDIAESCENSAASLLRLAAKGLAEAYVQQGRTITFPLRFHINSAPASFPLAADGAGSYSSAAVNAALEKGAGAAGKPPEKPSTAPKPPASGSA